MSTLFISVAVAVAVFMLFLLDKADVGPWYQVSAPAHQEVRVQAPGARMSPCMVKVWPWLRRARLSQLLRLFLNCNQGMDHHATRMDIQAFTRTHTLIQP